MKRIVVLLATLLLSFGLTNAAKIVSIPQPAPGDSLWFGESATLDISLENDEILGAMSLGFQVWSDDGATWQWENVGGYGASGCVTSTYPACRFDPAAGTGSFDMTGLLVTEQDVDESGRDTIMVGGVALNNGLPVGPLEHMYSYHFIPNGPDPDAKYTLCFDSCFVPPSGNFVFVNLAGQVSTPTVTWDVGGVCWPVAKRQNMCPEWDQGNPTSMSVDHCGSNSVALSATDPEDNTIQIQLGALNGGSGVAVVTDNGDGTCGVSYTATGADVGQAISIVVDITDAFHSWGQCDSWTIDVTVTNNAPTIDCGKFDNPVGRGNTLNKTDIVGGDADACDVLTYTVTTGDSPVGAYGIDAATGAFWFDTDMLDGDQTYTFCVTVDDGNATAECCFEVTVLSVEPWEVKIEKVHDALQGHYIDVDLCLNKGSEPIGGFDFLIGYDASALAFTGAELGQYLIDCGWEYFTYRYNWNGNCGNGCPSGLLRMVGMAETNNGPNHPDGDCIKDFPHTQEDCGCGVVIATMHFFLSTDITLECMYVPIMFYWMDCGDNTISTMSGDTLAINRYIYDISGNEMQDYTYGLPGYYGAPDDPCLDGDKIKPIRFIDFCNGGVDIICSDSIDARGDINVNGVANEIADAVMFTNYFITGVSAFSTHYEASRAASDVNADGIPLSVADLVYLVRVIVGDAPPYPKPVPETPVTIDIQGGTVTYHSPVDMGAALLTFEVNGDIGSPQLGSGVENMDIKYAREGNELRVLIYNIGSERIVAGDNVLVTIPGDITLIGAEVASFDGVGMDALIRTLPTRFEVNNYPNPFNPWTKIALNLPVASDWSVKIYNVAGQLVKDYSGYSEAGIHEIEWNATDNSGDAVASGIYFYKVQAGEFTATKKMVLMK